MAWFITVIVLILCVRFIENLRSCLTVLLICSAVIVLCVFSSAALGLFSVLAMTYGLYLIIKKAIDKKGDRKNVSKNNEHRLTPEQRAEIKKRIEKSNKTNSDDFYCRADPNSGYISPAMESFISSCNNYVKNREKMEEEAEKNKKQ